MFQIKVDVDLYEIYLLCYAPILNVSTFNKTDKTMDSASCKGEVYIGLI
jgi:hypothetical protein